MDPVGWTALGVPYLCVSGDLLGMQAAPCRQIVSVHLVRRLTVNRLMRFGLLMAAIDDTSKATLEGDITGGIYPCIYHDKTMNSARVKGWYGAPDTN